MSDTAKFLETLFGEKPDDAHILIWTLPDKYSHWHDTVDGAIKTVNSIKNHDVYVGVALCPLPTGRYPHKQRCVEANTTGIVGLWADIDILDPNHKKTNLPPDEAAAMELLATMELEPTVVVHSGHGLQAWWLFKEPWIFDDHDERVRAQQLSEKWTNTLRYRAKERGWDADATFDLARVLRVPGSVNYKDKSNPVPVCIRTLDDTRRYNPDDFEQFILDDGALKLNMGTTKKTTPDDIGPLFLVGTAQPDFDKMEILRSIEPKFNLTWDRKRTDFQDQSPSTYDLSLATYAAFVGWTDQEIANLIIAHRRKHQDDLKLRQDYYARTIAKAREAVKKSQAQEVIEEIAATSDGVVTIAPERKVQIVQALSAMFSVGIERIVRYTADPPQYRLETISGSIMLGEVTNLINQNLLRAKVAAATGRYIPKFKGDKWDGIAQALLDACEDETLGEEATEVGQAKAWLLGYLDENRPLESADEAAITKYPFVVDEYTYVFGSSLRRWLTISQGERISAKQMGAVLRAYGCEPETQGFKIGEKDTTRSVWRLPVRE